MQIEVEHLGGSSRAGQRQQVVGPLIRIGRRPDNDVAFDADGDRLVSGYHAELRVAEGAVTLTDLGSTSGSFLNGQPVTGPTPVQRGDELTLGEGGARLRLTWGEAAAPSRAAAAPSGAAAAPSGEAAAPSGEAAAPSDTAAPSRGIGHETLARAIESASVEQRRSHRLALGGVLAVAALAVGAGVFVYRRDAEQTAAERLVLARRTAEAERQAEQASQEARSASELAAGIEARAEAAVAERLTSYQRELEAVKGQLGRGESEVARLIVEISARDEALQELRQRQDLSQEERARLLSETEAKLGALQAELSQSQAKLREVADQGRAPDWAQLVDRYQRSIFLCLSVFDGKVGTGTAWCVREDGLLATNAHVVKGLQDALKVPGGEAWVVQNDTGRQFKIARMAYDARFTGPASPDVALIKLVGDARFTALPTASDDELRALRIGTQLGTLGYPGELTGVYVSQFQGIDKPLPTALATFKDGWIGRLTDYGSARAEFGRARLVHHSASLSGGTSGSPMFTADGKVVALNNAGLDKYVQVADEGGATHTERIANPAEIGQAIRVDELHAFMRAAKF